MSTVFSCPSCGVGLRVDALGAGPSMSGGWERGQEFAFGSGLPAGAAEYSRETPAANLANIESGARLPLIQAMITSAAAMLLTIVACWWWELEWVTVPVAGVVAGCLSWYLLLLQSRQLLSVRETATADPGAGDPAFSVEITLPPAEGKKMLFVNFPGCRPEHLRRFAQAAVEGKPTSEGARLSRAKFNAIREESLRRGLVRWRDPDYHTLGLETSSMGKAVFQRLLDGVLD